MREWRSDPEAPWWVKLRRARVHIDEVQRCVDVLRSSGAWSVQRAPAECADGWVFRFKCNRAIPADLSAVVGDAVANMRSALDYVAYELAFRNVGELHREQEAATAFPICMDEAAFQRFFTEGRWGSVRAQLYGEADRRALQCVQPFALGDEARAHGVEWSTSSQDELLTDHAYALNTLWNIDKHRRLPGLAWAREGPWWFSGDAFAVRQYVEHVREFMPLEDNAVFLEVRGAPGSGRPQVNLNQEIDLVLTDDPSPYPSPLVARLDRLHQVLTGWVIPRVFIVAESGPGSPPPIGIFFAPPT